MEFSGFLLAILDKAFYKDLRCEKETRNTTVQKFGISILFMK